MSLPHFHEHKNMFFQWVKPQRLRKNISSDADRDLGEKNNSGI